MPDHKPADSGRYLASEAETLALGAELGRGLEPGLVIYLCGDLGAGKTTFARGILQGLGYAGKVKSPTFTLVELYKFSRLYLYHFDFYRFNDPRELVDAGFRDYFNPESVCLVEWPERAAASLPPPDVKIVLQFAGTGRRIELFADTEVGRRCLSHLKR